LQVESGKTNETSDKSSADGRAFHYVRSTVRDKRLRNRWIAGLAFVLLSCAPIALASLRAGQNAWLGQARGYINPATGTAQVAGYFVFVEGVREPFFSGNPSEATAFLTFRSDTLSLSPPIANGPDVSATMFSPGTFTVYFNTSPSGNFASLDSFSSGKPIATFLRSTGMITSVVGSTGTATFSAKLISSQDFVFQGQTVNFGKLVPNGVTILITTSPNFVAGTAAFPVAQPFTFSAIAIGNESGSNEQ
jgi:hypothetical protein